MELRAGGAVLAAETSAQLPAEGAFLSVVVVAEVGAAHPQLGQPLTILGNLNAALGIEVNFDDVRLECEPLFTRYCTSNANSTGAPAQISASDSLSASTADLQVSVGPVPSQFSVFFHAQNQGQVPFGCGFLCAVNDIRRGAVVAGSGQLASNVHDGSDEAYALDFFVGSELGFQYWFSDPARFGSCGDSFSTSDAIRMPIVP